MSVPPNSILQMLRGGLDRALNGAPSPYLEPDEQKAVNAQRRQAMIAALLQGAAPRPQGTGNTLGDLGNALAAGNRAQAGGLDDAMKARITGMQIQQMRAQSVAAAQRAAAEQAKADAPVVVGKSLVMKDGRLVYSEPEKADKPDISEAAKKTAELEKLLGRPLTEPERLDMFGIKPTEAKPDELDKPYSPTDLARVRTANGQSFPIGTTPRQAMAAGGKVYSDTELTRQVNTSKAVNTLGEIKQLALGKNGAFVDNGGSPLTNNVLARMANGVSNGIGAFIGTEASVRRAVFNSTSEGAISSLVRSMGEAGSLSDGDVKRALSLIPVLGTIPDTEATAKAKFKELQKIISDGASGLSAPASGGAEFTYDPATGKLVPK